jgi:hypothetical protein
VNPVDMKFLKTGKLSVVLEERNQEEKYHPRATE